jgi:tRNA pseudouridine38-40 synthase
VAEQRLKLVIAYLGTPFHGWQRQLGQRTVQGELERALRRMTGGLQAAVVGAGRTDSGVHAAGQTAHVDLPATIPTAGLLKGLNGLLPEEIRVRRVVRAPASFHARRSACAKHYAYRICWQAPTLPWRGLRMAQVRPVNDWQGFDKAVAMLPGRRDMGSFSVTDPDGKPGQRNLFSVKLERRQAGGINLHFVGDGFLRYQVRRMVGALLEVGWGQRSLAQLDRLLDHPQPGCSIWTAPARGLTLEQVFYRGTFS